MSSATGREALAFVDGEVVPLSEATVPLADRAVLFGFGLFETIRVVAGVPYALHEHRARLTRSATALGLDTALTQAPFAFVVGGLVSAWGPRSGVLKVVLTGGAPPDVPPALYGIMAAPRPLPNGARTRGVTLALGGRRQAFEPGHLAGVDLLGLKRLAYLENLLVIEAARAQGCHDAIVLDGRGRPTECCVSNLFWIASGRLYTPSLALGALPGIARARVMILAGEIGLPVVEGKEGFDDLLRAEEVFVTNVLNGVLGVRSVVGHGTFLAPGPRTRELSGLLERHVALSSSRAAGG